VASRRDAFALARQKTSPALTGIVLLMASVAKRAGSAL